MHIFIYCDFIGFIFGWPFSVFGTFSITPFQRPPMHFQDLDVSVIALSGDAWLDVEKGQWLVVSENGCLEGGK